MDKFIDRVEAGNILAKHLKEFANNPNVIVIALPRGGVPVAYQVSQALSVPLDIMVVRKLGLPEHKELAMGAIASGGTVFFNQALINQLNLDESILQGVMKNEQKELLRREHLYRGQRPFTNLKNKMVILVDDGIATGSTMMAAIKAIRMQKPSSIVVAVPVAARTTYEEIMPLVDKIVCPIIPVDFYAVGLWYENFQQTSDEEVIELLQKSLSHFKSTQAKYALNTQHHIRIQTSTVTLDGILHIPQQSIGLVIFVHGSGSSRLSIRNQFVARVLNQAKIATLLFDLLTPDEDEIDSQTGEFRFDIDFLASRLVDVTRWCLKQEQLGSLSIGYFGASTGGGAALVAASEKPEWVQAIVSRGGRPDLAAISLPFVEAPTLLIVGGDDEVVIEMNRKAMKQLKCKTDLKIIPGATHLFEESGALEKVAELARDWFIQFLGNSSKTS
jgi:putative phosphoribosyl transferase